MKETQGRHDERHDTQGTRGSSAVASLHNASIPVNNMQYAGNRYCQYFQHPLTLMRRVMDLASPQQPGRARGRARSLIGLKRTYVTCVCPGLAPTKTIGVASSNKPPFTNGCFFSDNFHAFNQIALSKSSYPHQQQTYSINWSHDGLGPLQCLPS
ncbi:hypothetical protein BGZ63DRAFT_234554 [Mariannaea sp. PMI_226]|nr:hypothetical protein BGZ63DRAFT_234554 [Mariannaea sp. PMI_226]